MEVYSATASVCIWKHMWQRQTRAHARMHAHTQTCTHTHTCAHTHIYTHVCMHTHTHTHMHAHTHACTHALTHTCTHTRMHTHTLNHTSGAHTNTCHRLHIYTSSSCFLRSPLSGPFFGISTVLRRTVTHTLVHLQYLEEQRPIPWYIYSTGREEQLPIPWYICSTQPNCCPYLSTSAVPSRTVAHTWYICSIQN